MDNIRLLLVSPNPGAHQIKKIREGFLQTGRIARLRVLAFDRPIEKKPDFPYESLGTIQPRRYWSRLRCWWQAFWRIRSAMKTSDVVFAFIMDCVFLTVLSKLSLRKTRCRLVYNIRDVHPLCTHKGFVGVFFRAIDRFLCKRVDLLVVTSPLYVTDYINGVLGLSVSAWFALENKVPPELRAACKDPLARPPRVPPRIGYFGMMSYANSWEIIKKAAGWGASFYIRGHNYLGGDFLQELPAYPSVTYAGPYKNPDDMGAMFEQIDVSWAVNSECFHPGTNDAWALCNRFYEALYFRKPVIVQEGSAHAQFVRTHDIGMVVDARKADETARALANMSAEQVSRWQANLENIPPSAYLLEDNAYARVFDVLDALPRDGAGGL